MNTLDRSITTLSLCWHCNHDQPFYEPHCERCGATNPNVDLDTAQDECADPSRIVPYAERVPALLRVQAA